MTYLKKFGLKNFRVFKDMSELEFAPITVLTGANSSGKSSVIKAMLLLQQNISKSYYIGYTGSKTELKLELVESLEFSGPFHGLASFGSCQNDDLKSDKMVFKLPVHFNWGEEAFVELVYMKSESETSTRGMLHSIKGYSLSAPELLFDFSVDDKDNWLIWANYHYFRSVMDKLASEKFFNQADKQKEDLEDKKKLKRNSELSLKKSEGQPLTNKEKNELNELKEWYNKWRNKLSNCDYEAMFCHDEIIFHNIVPAINSKFEINLEKYRHSLTFFPFPFLFDLNDEDLYSNDSDIVASYKMVSEHLRAENPLLETSEEVLGFVKNQINEISNKLMSCLFEPEYDFMSKEELIQALIKGEAVFFELLEYSDIGYDIKKMDTVYNDPKQLVSQLGYFVSQLAWQPLNYLFNPNDPPIKIYLEKLEMVNNKTLRKCCELYLNAIDTYYEMLKNNLSYITALALISEQYRFKFRTSKHYFIADLIFPSIIDGLNESVSSFKSINFSEAVRANTQRIYTHNSQGTGMNELLKDFEKLELDRRSMEWLFVEKWIRLFNIGEKLSIAQNEDGLGIHVRIDGRSLADNGYGITQFLPILLKIAWVARANIGIFEPHHSAQESGYGPSIIIIEEPETNLHPKLQSMLADMFVDAAKQFHIQFIVETHSEYLIRKLQYLTANKNHEYNINPQDTAVYYFNDPRDTKNGEQQIRRIRIKENGVLDGGFGPGFFDEASRLILGILELPNEN